VTPKELEDEMARLGADPRFYELAGELAMYTKGTGANPATLAAAAQHCIEICRNSEPASAAGRTDAIVAAVKSANERFMSERKRD
jgi:hypothetical protein